MVLRHNIVFRFALVVSVMKFKIVTAVFGLICLSWADRAIAQYRTDRPTFYQDGQQQLEREINRLNQKKPDNLLTIDSEPIHWQEFKFKPGNFAVLIPNTLIDQQDTLSTTEGTLDLKEFSTQTNSLRLVVAYSDYLSTANLSNSEVVLANVRDRLVDKLGVKLVRDSSITLGDYPGKELKLQSSTEQIIFRLFLVKQRLYIVGVTQKNNVDSSKDMAKFLASFRLIK